MSDCAAAEALVLCASSNIRIPTEGVLHIFSPGALQRLGACERDCMRVGAFDVPHSHKLTTPMMAGQPQTDVCACVGTNVCAYFQHITTYTPEAHIGEPLYSSISLHGSVDSRAYCSAVSCKAQAMRSPPRPDQKLECTLQLVLPCL